MNHLSRVFISLLIVLCGAGHVHAAEKMKEWNFLVFINGKNSLDSFGPMNINQMEQVGSNDNMNIIVEWGSTRNPGVKRLLVQKDNNTSDVTSPVVQNLGNVDMGDYKELVRFVDWANQNYPAKKYFIVVWNHGNGWHFTGANNNGAPTIQDISYDDQTGNKITTEQLDRKSTRLNSSHTDISRMPSSA